MTHVFFWANHLGFYPAASVSLRAHGRLDTAVASIASSTSNIICNILISVITLIQASQGDLSHLACVYIVWSGHNVTQFMPCPSLTSASHLNICTADSMRQPCLWAHMTYLHVWGWDWCYHTLNTDSSLSITYSSDCRKEKKNNAILCHFLSPTHYYEIMSHN